MQKIKTKSHAKINLVLEVTKKLPNGFHELRTVMTKLDGLFDELEIVFDEKKTGIEIVCDNPGIPTDEKNICWKIATKFFALTKKNVGLKITIKKNIPPLSGMGGGSSNGASVLLALNEYFGNILSQKKLIALASEVGKDIPFFLASESTVYVSGMGEKLQSIENFPVGYFLIINSGEEISTPLAYGELDQDLVFMNNPKRKNLCKNFIDESLKDKKISARVYNDFSIIAKKKYPHLEILEKALLSFGARSASISGKGPTLFGIFSSRKEALQAREVLKKYYPKFFIEIA